MTGVIAAATYLLWVMISPYSTGVLSAVLLSVVLRHRFNANVDHDLRVSKQVSDFRIRFAKDSPSWLWWVAVLLGGGLHVFNALDHAAVFNGFDKYPLLRKRRDFRVVCFIVLVGYLCHCLRGVYAMMNVGFGALAIFALLVWWVSDDTMPKLMRFAATFLFGTLIALLFVRSMAEEATQFHQDGLTTIRYIRGLGVNIPQEAIDKAPVLLSNYLFSENTTALFMELASALPPKDGTTTSMTPGEAASYAWDAMRRGDVDQLRRMIPHNTAAIGEIGLSISSHAKVIGVMISNAIISFVLSLLAVIYEVGLFYFVLRFLGKSRHTVVYHLAHRILSWSGAAEEENKRLAKAWEEYLTEKFDLLFQSYWHLSIFNFVATYGVLSAFTFKYPISAGLFSVIFAVIPIGVPVSLPCWTAIGISVYRGSYIDAVFLASATLLVQTFGGLIPFFTVANDEKDKPATADTNVVATSVILGFVSFGLKGIVLGPVILIAAQGLWRVSRVVADSQTEKMKAE